MTDTQKTTVQGIVNIFETGKLAGDYGAVTVAAGDAGHLTYGRSQTTLASGSLYSLIEAYCNAPDAAYASQLQPYLARLQAKDVSLDQDMTLRGVLKQAGSDAVMRQVQDKFFDDVYWTRALRLAATAVNGAAITTALGMAAVYDSTIHGSFTLIRDRTNAAVATGTTEQEWVARYVELRKTWLATHKNALLHRCVYRMEELEKLIAAGNWDLTLPITVRGVQITEDALASV